MAEARNGQHTSGHSFAWSIFPVAGNPLLAVATDINGKLLEHVAGAQKDWADFVHRRFKEDLAASRQLMNCQSFGDIQQIYSQYLRTAAEQCREQSERALQRGQAMAKELPWPALRPNGNHGGDAALGE
jgi:phasin protein